MGILNAVPDILPSDAYFMKVSAMPSNLGILRKRAQDIDQPSFRIAIQRQAAKKWPCHWIGNSPAFGILLDSTCE